MADEEVARILGEIRERVRSESPVTAFNAERAATGSGSDNGAGTQGLDRGAATTEVALIGSYLTTTERTWDRLPPLVSNRSGALARVELWLKRHAKAAARWFTWEQINFNAAVHHALRDIVQVLEEVRAESDERRLALEKYVRAIDAQLVAIETQHRTALEAQRVTSEAKRAQGEARLMELLVELQERESRLQDEQRVCLKQLSLETSESAVLEERARRKVDGLLKELTRRIEELEDRKS